MSRNYRIFIFLLAIIWISIPAHSAQQVCYSSLPKHFYASPVCRGYCVPVVPVALGLGPAPQLATLCGVSFDQYYVKSVYQLHNTISALASKGITQNKNAWLRKISNKILSEQTKQNEALANLSKCMNIGAIAIDCSASRDIINQIANCPGSEFEYKYVYAMSALLGQARDAGWLAVYNATTCGLRDQGRIVVRSTQNEIDALLRWAAQCNYTKAR